MKKYLLLVILTLFTTIAFCQAATHGVTLSWGNPNTGTTTFNVYRSLTSGGEIAPPLATGLTVLTYADNTAVVGTKYFYTVTATVGGVESAPSLEVSAQIVLPNAPTNPAATIH